MGGRERDGRDGKGWEGEEGKGGREGIVSPSLATQFQNPKTASGMQANDM